MTADYTPIVNSFFGTLGLIVMGYFALLTARMKHNAEMEAIAQAKRDEQAAKQLDVVQKTTRATHTFVNSGWGNQLKITALAMRRVADLTKDPADGKIADLAEQALAEHQKGQKEVDAQPGTDAEKKGDRSDPSQPTIGQVVGEMDVKVGEIHKAVVKPEGER